MLRPLFRPADLLQVQGHIAATTCDLMDLRADEAARVAISDTVRIVDDDTVMFTCIFVPIGVATMVDKPTTFNGKRGSPTRGWRLMLEREGDRWIVTSLHEPEGVTVREFVRLPIDLPIEGEGRA